MVCSVLVRDVWTTKGATTHKTSVGMVAEIVLIHPSGFLCRLARCLLDPVAAATTTTRKVSWTVSLLARQLSPLPPSTAGCRSDSTLWIRLSTLYKWKSPRCVVVERALVLRRYVRAIRHVEDAVLTGWRKTDPRYLMKGKRRYRLQHLHTRRESPSLNFFFPVGEWLLHLIL